MCPRLSDACPDLFCPFNCAGRGVCNYETVVNGTVRPTCECFDPTDTSPGCSDSLLPAGDFMDDATGLFDNVQEDFFDPLVAVFVDHPDKWTSSSWAWAAGLFTVFLVMLLCICSTFWPESNKKELESAKFGIKSPGSSPRSRSRSPRKSSQRSSKQKTLSSTERTSSSSSHGKRRSSSQLRSSASPRHSSSPRNYVASPRSATNRSSSHNPYAEYHQSASGGASPRQYPISPRAYPVSPSAPRQKTYDRPSSPTAADI